MYMSNDIWCSIIFKDMPSRNHMLEETIFQHKCSLKFGFIDGFNIVYFSYFHYSYIHNACACTRKYAIHTYDSVWIAPQFIFCIISTHPIILAILCGSKLQIRMSLFVPYQLFPLRYLLSKPNMSLTVIPFITSIESDYHLWSGTEQFTSLFFVIFWIVSCVRHFRCKCMLLHTTNFMSNAFISLDICCSFLFWLLLT